MQSECAQRVAIYARVSTTNHGQDVGLQTRELREFAEARGWHIADEYIDEGVRGAKDSRPELNRLMADAHKRRFDVVCVWRFDRFARSVSHLLRALETFKAIGIDFVSYSEQMDTSTPAGKMVFTVLGAVAEPAELERSLIVERVKAPARKLVGMGMSGKTRSPRRWSSCARDEDAISKAEVMDGIFPLSTNADLDACAVLRAYKYQPTLEKRHALLKSGLQVAPIFLKKNQRIEALMFVYFLAQLVCALIERQLRDTMRE